jgi:hypothetical protein
MLAWPRRCWTNHYEGEEIAEIASRFAFEVLEEPDEKPELDIRFR